MTNPASSCETGATTGRSRYGITFWCTVVLAVLGAYVVAYIALQRRVVGPGSPRLVEVHYGDDAKRQGVFEQFFSPVHWVDEKIIRRKFWTGNDVRFPPGAK